MAATPDSTILEQPAATVAVTFTPVVRAVMGLMATDFAVVVAHTGRRLMLNLVCIPAHLADLTTEALHRATRSGAARVSVAAMVEAAATSFKPAARTITTENLMITKMGIRFDERVRGKVATAFAALLIGLHFVPLSFAQQQDQQTFHSAAEASLALFTAAQQENVQAMLDILGPAGKELISSGDPAEDMNDRIGFVVKYKEMHRLVEKPGGTMILYVGAENWPFPIPLASKDETWFFDTDAGKEEILVRRIGKNELAAIDACQQLVAAEQEYYKKPFRGQPHYSERFVSDKGKRNGLYKADTPEEFDSPVDPLIASAGQESRNSTGAATNEPIPFNGYYFRILTGQGENAPGGAKSYIANGRLIGGFGFVAYPAEYRSSGVVTFVVNQSGVVYEKDLGPDTVKLATAMTSYNPDSTWHGVE